MALFEKKNNNNFDQDKIIQEFISSLLLHVTGTKTNTNSIFYIKQQYKQMLFGVQKRKKRESNQQTGKEMDIFWLMKESVNMCSLPLELPPSRMFLFGWNAVMEHTVVRWSMFRKVWRRRPLSWYTWIWRGLSTLPITKHSCCFGSHTALSLDSHRPVCMLCLHKSNLAGCYNGYL